MKLILLFIFSCGLTLVYSNCERDREIICYWGSWSIYRREIGFFNVSNINTDICTTIVYAFAGLDLNLDLASIDSNADITRGGFAEFVKLKQKEPCLKTMVAVGGWNEGTRKFSVASSTTESRKNLAQSILKFLVYYGFDGIDIDWEYPTSEGGLPEDGSNFVELLNEIKTAISPWGLKLSIAVSFDNSLIGTGYNIIGINKSVDFVNLMAYDYISSNSNYTGLSAPLSKINETVTKWLNGGLSSKKLALGIPAYCKNFVLKDPQKNGIGAEVKAIGLPGDFTQQEGLLAYYEVLQIESIRKTAVNMVDGTIYGYHDDEWMTYDNEETVSGKVKYAISQNLGGIMFWSLELDDFNGEFGDPYPLLNAVHKEFKDFV
ncbi:unnamed protein product [Phyllotreta striolata]|uniref:GH18 domain-containing protein n=1 Tax=Phyllotreta striolata TaxID=444603 RepID=A0A9N9TXR1_PHYSR|nr:unnamed protein product [Phyllotreta striolata]